MKGLPLLSGSLIVYALLRLFRKHLPQMGHPFFNNLIQLFGCPDPIKQLPASFGKGNACLFPFHT